MKRAFLEAPTGAPNTEGRRQGETMTESAKFYELRIYHVVPRQAGQSGGPLSRPYRCALCERTTRYVVLLACDSGLWLEGNGKALSVSPQQAVPRVALRKLLQLHATTELRVLASPPGNQLEALRGNRKGQHSIRINDQWGICFVWREGHCYDVEIVDYH
jgi:proteic killer suppression protein